jgi:hypothetical protein
MTSRATKFGLLGGVLTFLLILAPNAFAKHSGTGGQTQIDCGDGVITYSPTTLWPANHKMQTVSISFAETQPESAPDVQPDTLGLQVTGISSNQDAEDAAGTGGCGPKTASQGDDWSFDGTLILGAAGDDTVTVHDDVQVRAERCSKDKSARTYTIDITCTDEGTTDAVQLFVSVPHDQGHKKHH